MASSGDFILEQLRNVELLRAQRRADAALDIRVSTVKAYQQARFSRTYADLLVQPRYAGATRFFLEELYGPGDFALRDAQFARIVPALVRLFPHEIVQTVAGLGALHALSEQLDVQMARHIDILPLDAIGYVRAWQTTGGAAERQRQIDLTMEVGRAMEAYTRNPMLRHSLRLMRIPARAAGLSTLQTFLEMGFDTFKEIGGAGEFLAIVSKREGDLSASLFAVDAGEPGAAVRALGEGA